MTQAPLHWTFPLVQQSLVQFIKAPSQEKSSGVYPEAVVVDALDILHGFMIPDAFSFSLVFVSSYTVKNTHQPRGFL